MASQLSVLKAFMTALKTLKDYSSNFKKILRIKTKKNSFKVNRNLGFGMKICLNNLDENAWDFD